MFWNNFKYSFLSTLRAKDVIFWMILFPLALATMFNIAFSSIYEKTEKFDAIPVAVTETEENKTFKTVLDELAKSDEPLFTVEYLSEKEAEEKLKSEEIQVIFNTTADDITLEVKEDGVRTTIAEYFIQQYKTQETIITDTIKNNPEKLESVLETLSAEVNTNENIPLTDGNMDTNIQYFYNLIAMVCLYGSISGLMIATDGQANLSAIGARKCCSPTNKFISITADIIAKYLCQVLCIFISITYIVFVLKIDMGNRIPMVYLSGATGSLLGITMGFFIGSIGRISFNAKVAVSMVISMTCSFLSGLMVGNMKAILAKHAPIVNEINPAAMVSDLFYCLNIYKDYDRYIVKTLSIIALSVFFTIGGYILTRRKKYASL
ncbi:MAG: ABC transporter permease [Hominimerdicola sp.]